MNITAHVGGVFFFTRTPTLALCPPRPAVSCFLMPTVSQATFPPSTPLSIPHRHFPFPPCNCLFSPVSTYSLLTHLNPPSPPSPLYPPPHHFLANAPFSFPLCSFSSRFCPLSSLVFSSSSGISHTVCSDTVSTFCPARQPCNPRPAEFCWEPELPDGTGQNPNICVTQLGPIRGSGGYAAV